MWPPSCELPSLQPRQRYDYKTFGACVHSDSASLSSCLDHRCQSLSVPVLPPLEVKQNGLRCSSWRGNRIWRIWRICNLFAPGPAHTCPFKPVTSPCWKPDAATAQSAHSRGFTWYVRHVPPSSMTHISAEISWDRLMTYLYMFDWHIILYLTSRFNHCFIAPVEWKGIHCQLLSGGCIQLLWQNTPPCDLSTDVIFCKTSACN
jgi:hypothetical protein